MKIFDPLARDILKKELMTLCSSPNVAGDIINITWFSDNHNAFNGRDPTVNGRHSNLL